jgi:SAM-dependent methyltransferase
LKTVSNKEFYQKSIEEFGVSAQGVHWNSKYTQYKRFEILTKCIKKDIKGSNVVDVGCGFGEYYNYLLKNHKLPQKYIGVDCEEKMIDVCNIRFPNEQFLVQNILQDDLIKADYYICSGAMNILSFDEVEIFIKKCFEASNKGFVFNYLKNVTFNDIKQHDVEEICKRYSHSLILKDGYLDNDFTIFMVK